MKTARARLIEEITMREMCIGWHHAAATLATKFAREGNRDLARIYGENARENLEAYRTEKAAENADA